MTSVDYSGLLGEIMSMRNTTTKSGGKAKEMNILI